MNSRFVAPAAPLEQGASALAAALDAIDRAAVIEPAESAAALAAVLAGIITGEGPSTAGRVHFSRTIDAADAALCERILIAGAGARNEPITRAEADVLFDIDAAGTERCDGGRFDDLFVKAVTHHALSAAGRPVPPRHVALTGAAALKDWAPDSDPALDAEVRQWIVARTRTRRPMTRSLATLTVLLIGATALPIAQSIASIADLAS